MTITDGTPAGSNPTIGPDGTVTLADGTAVTLQELTNGYMRQADYTRKTQDVANQRRLAERGLNLLSALDQNPQAALATIAEHYGVQMPRSASAEKPKPPTAIPHTNEWGEPVEQDQSAMDPVVQDLTAQISRLQAQLGQVAQTQQRTALMGEIESAQARYGDSFDREEVLRHMQANNIPTVEMAYRDLHWDTAAAALQSQSQLQQEQDQALAQKRQLAGVVTAGDGISPTQTHEPPIDYGEAARQGGFKAALAAAFSDSMGELGIEGVHDPRLMDG